MKASELRIGNLIGFIPRENKIHIPVTWIPHKVVSIEIGKVKTIFPHENLAHISKPMEFTYSDIVGIPLTEEWLEKSEFVFDLKEGEYDNGVHNEVFSGSIVVKKRHGNSNYKWELCIGTVDIRYFNYLYELQNLIFALTGTELEIK